MQASDRTWESSTIASRLRGEFVIFEVLLSCSPRISLTPGEQATVRALIGVCVCPGSDANGGRPHNGATFVFPIR